jgi:hypothetical protein
VVLQRGVEERLSEGWPEGEGNLFSAWGECVKEGRTERRVERNCACRGWRVDEVSGEVSANSGMDVG